jgi:uncharacterized protein YggE
MSTIEEPRNRSTRNVKKLVFFAGLLAAGLLTAAALFAGTQMLNAHAQTSSEIDTLGQNNSFVQAPSLSANLSTVSTSGTATTRVTPDMFSVIVGVETNGTTAQEAVSRNANLTGQVIAALSGLGISENQIGTSTYSVLPIYEYRPPLQPCPEIYPPPPGCEPRQEIIGYSASNSVTVTLNVNAGVDAGQIIDASVQAGANNVNGLYFFVSPDRQQEIRDSLFRDAIASARQRANIAAEALGMTVSQVQSVDLREVFFPIFRGLEEVSTAEAADSVSLPTPILPGEQEVSTTVSIVFYMSSGSSEED